MSADSTTFDEEDGLPAAIFGEVAPMVGQSPAPRLKKVFAD
jgi:hypothetical protein